MYIESLNQIKVSNATWRGRFSGRDYKEIGSVWDTLSSLPAPFGKGTSNRANNIPWGYYITSVLVNLVLKCPIILMHIIGREVGMCKPLQRPTMLQLDYYNLKSLRHTFRTSGCKVIMVIIPDDE